MAKHRSAAQIEIASTTEHTWLHEFVDRYWKLAAMVAVGITAGILVRQWRGEGAQRDFEASWNRLSEEVGFNALLASGPLTAPSPAVLASLAEELGTTDAAAWTLAIEVGKHVENEDYDAAQTTLEELRAAWPDHPLAKRAFFPSAAGVGLEPLEAHLRDRPKRLKAWEEAHPLLFANPPLPDDAPRVKLNTPQGSIVLGLYSDRAPKHAENFLKLCREGYYDTTLFHRVIADRMIQGGDPNTRDGAPDTWGLGEPEETIEAETDPQLRHFAGVLSAARKPTETASSGSQFFLTTTPYHAWDGDYTIFGIVLEGLDVVEGIANAAATAERPEEPVLLESTEVL